MSSSKTQSPQRRVLKGCGLILGLFLSLCCVLLISGTIIYRFKYPPLPTATEAIVDVVDDQVAQLRGLEFQQPVTFTLMTAAELRQSIEADFATEWSIEEAQDEVIIMAAFDLLEPNFDLYNLYLDLYSEQIAGYYDPEEKTLYVISDNGAMNL